jgi:hypothetical protein
MLNNIYSLLKTLVAYVSLIVMFLSCSKAQKSTQLGRQNLLHEDRALQEERVLPNMIGFEILKLQKKYNISPSDPITLEVFVVEEGGEETEQERQERLEMARLGELIQTLDEWEKEPYIVGSELDDRKIRSLFSNFSGSIMNLFFLEYDRALVFAGDIKEKDHNFILEEGGGKLYYLVKSEMKWEILYIRDWFFQTLH